MKIVFISGASSKEELEQYSKKYAKRPMRFVQQWWDYSFASAMKKICGVDFLSISFPPVSTFPSSKCVVAAGRKAIDENGMEIIYPGMINLPGLKQITLMRNIKRQLLRVCHEYPDEPIVVLTHCIYMQSAVPAFLLRKKYKVKVFSIIPDLPEHGTAAVFANHKVLSFLFKQFVNYNTKLSKGYDGYICFSEPQMEHLNRQKPHIVMEGFFDYDLMAGVESKEYYPNRVVYAGGLMYRYGIRELVDGFAKADIDGAELYIYGNGEAEEYIKGKENQRIYYGGCLSRDQMIQTEKSVFLLVNPRPTNDEYSRCSFPSKLMEYMASGTPTLTSKLGCIGREYDDKLEYIEDTSSDGIAEALTHCFANKDRLKIKGRYAAQYIKEHKNVDVQAKKVIDFLWMNGEKKNGNQANQ